MLKIIGSLGSISFNVSENSVKTFSDLNFQRKASFAEHKILNGKGLLEYTGHDAATCSLKIDLNASMGINPKDELEKLRELFNNREVVNFMLGPDVLGEWVIESMSENLKFIGRNGEIISAEINLTLKEYLANE